MRTLVLVLLAALVFCCPSGRALAQASATVVTACGTLPLAYVPGAVRSLTMDPTGKLCDSATGGGGDATAANQALQITQETAINTILGLQADAACTTDNGSCTIAALTKRNNQRLTTINTTLGTPMQATGGTVGLVAGSAVVGNFRIDQTTPGTTNAVQVTNTNVNGQAAMANSSPVVLASNQTSIPVAATLGAETTKIIGTVNQSSQYPVGSTAITASNTGTTGATTATLAGTSGKTTYICWYSIRANATAATTVTNTITGTITGTLSSLMWVAPAASGIGLDEMIFPPCTPASAANTGIAVVSGAPGAGGNVTVKAGGYQL